MWFISSEGFSGLQLLLGSLRHHAGVPGRSFLCRNVTFRIIACWVVSGWAHGMGWRVAQRFHQLAQLKNTPWPAEGTRQEIQKSSLRRSLTHLTLAPGLPPGWSNRWRLTGEKRCSHQRYRWPVCRLLLGGSPTAAGAEEEVLTEPSSLPLSSCHSKPSHLF